MEEQGKECWLGEEEKDNVRKKRNTGEEYEEGIFFLLRTPEERRNTTMIMGRLQKSMKSERIRNNRRKEVTIHNE